jgi:hypothetical protein
MSARHSADPKEKRRKDILAASFLRFAVQTEKAAKKIPGKGPASTAFSNASDHPWVIGAMAFALSARAAGC